MSTADIPQVPHDPYPQDGMTQFCRTKPNMGPPSERSSQPSPNRPSSRDSVSEYSNPSSLTSYGPSSGQQSPVKQMAMPISPVEEDVSPKKRGFFNSPFRRRSKHERENSQASSATATPTNASRNTWGRSAGRSATDDSANSPSRYHKGGARGNEYARGQPSASPEAEQVDPRANFQLNVGGNVFDVASPDAQRPSPTKPAQSPLDLDPIAQALEELKGVTKASSVRVSADRYAGLATPAPPGTPGGMSSPLPGAVRTPLANGSHGTPPPSYDQPVSRLGAPPAAHTSRAMQETTKKYTAQKQDMFNSTPSHQRAQSQNQGGSWGRQSKRQGPEQMRSSSPAPPRATSPRPGMYDQQPQQGSYNRPPSQGGYSNHPPSQAGYNNRAVSPNPYQGRPRANTNYGSARGASPSMNIPRAVSPQPHFGGSQSRPGSRAGGPMAMQLASPGPGSEYGTQRGRPQSQYYAGSSAGSAAGNEVGRVRSKSVAEPKQFTRDGTPIMHYGMLNTSTP
jgi:hypothetical protein